MGGIRKNILLKVFMVLCAVVQFAAVMPHHHHESSDVPCINPLHSIEAHSHAASHHEHETAGCTGHEDECGSHLCLHNTCTHGRGQCPDGSDAECTLTHLDLNPPVRDRITFIPPVTDLGGVFAVTISDELLSSACHDHSGAGDVVCCSVFSGTIALYTHICTSSIPARAPSFLV